MKKIKNTKPRILQIVPSLYSGGVERGTVDITVNAVKDGYEMYVCSAGGTMVPAILEAGGKHIKLPVDSKNPFKIFKNIKLIEEIIKENEIDIIHARSRAPAWSAYFAAKRTNIKFLTTFHGVYNFNNSIKKKYNSIMAKGKKVIAVSNFVKEHIISNYKINPESIEVIHRGVDLDYFKLSEVSNKRIATLIKDLDIPFEKPVITLPGRISRWKGQKFLIDALARIKKEEFFCIIAGDARRSKNYKKELDKHIKDLGLKGRVIVTRNINDMPALYALSTVVICPSIEPEAFGRIPTEAQAMGTPIIATTHGGACETVIDKKTGWLVGVGDVEDLSQKIQMVLNMTKEDLEKIGKNGIKNIEKEFSLVRMYQKTKNIYDNL